MDTEPRTGHPLLADLESRAATRRDLVKMIADVSREEMLGEQVGHTVPRIMTPPLVSGPPGGCACGCALTPETSYGFDVIEFASGLLGRPLDPWQELAAIHVGELLPDGRPRFRVIVIIVARQNGKTEFLAVLTAFWLFIEKRRMILGTSSNLEYAKEAWEKTVTFGTTTPALAAMLPDTDNQGVRRTNGQVQMELITPDGLDYQPRYKIAAANRRGGRGLTLDKLVQDEVREQSSWDAWNAAVPATNAVIDAQVFLISNQGDDSSVVLDSIRQSAIDGVDERMGILEYSSPEGSRPDDVEALAYANPNLGRRISVPALLGDAARAMKSGGAELAGFQTEIMCMKVRQLNPAVNPIAWADCYSEGDLAQVRARVALCIDVSMDQLHAVAVAAAVIDTYEDDHRTGENFVRLESIEAWEGPGCLNRMVHDLPGIVTLIRPKVIGWFPGGPAAAVSARLAERKPGKRTPRWPPRGVSLEEIVKDVPAVCMEFADEVSALTVLQPGDELISAHVLGAEKLWEGDRWRFARPRDAAENSHVNAAYAAAGALHLARTLPAARPPAGAA